MFALSKASSALLVGLALLGILLWLALAEIKNLNLKIEAQDSDIEIERNKVISLTASNHALGSAVGSYKQLLIESHQVEKELRRHTETIDGELQQTLSDLEHLRNEQEPASDCELRFSDAELDRMREYYGTTRTDRLSTTRGDDVSAAAVANSTRDANQ